MKLYRGNIHVPSKMSVNPFPGLVLAAVLILGIAGCAGGPDPEKREPVGHTRIDPIDHPGMKRFRSDQKQRQRLTGSWQVDGSMEIQLKDDVRRHRMELEGRGGQQIRLRIFGPFRNVAMELTMIPEWLRLVHPGDRVRLEVAAERSGMAALTGLAFNPSWLYPALMGCAAEPAGSMIREKETLVGDSRSGEKLWIDSRTGALKKRTRVGNGGRPFTVEYEWPEQSPDAMKNHLQMPLRVDIRLEDDDSRLTLSLNEWKFFDGGGDLFAAADRLPPFRVLYPEIGDGGSP
ncbi:MAG: hypothetical protein HQL76_00170 [Magnetococcales bacterium]|nr:hypothetical protein [Magnetococcales bacterium]